MFHLKRISSLAAFVLLLPAALLADTTSYTGTLASSTDSYALDFTVTGLGTETVTVQTFGFGGGTNAAGTSIAAGGFDPFIGLFAGTGAGASLLTDALGNPYGTSDLLSNFASFTGCPPAGTQNVGGTVCGDITMTLALAAGDYTLLLSDGGYIPNAIFDNGTLGEGFSDFTGGAFQTCNTDPTGVTTCVNDTANWAFDLTTKPNVVSTSEPGSLALLVTGIAAFAVRRRRART